MIKKIFVAILIALPMMAVAQAPKFGVVNTQTLIQDLPDFKEAQEQIASVSKKYEDEFSKLKESMEKTYADFQALPQDTPETIKERRIQEIQDLDQKMQQFQATATQDIQRQQETLMAPIQEKVRQALNAVGKENNMTFIFESLMPLYTGTDVTDVTPLVRAKLGLK